METKCFVHAGGVVYSRPLVNFTERRHYIVLAAQIRGLAGAGAGGAGGEEDPRRISCSLRQPDRRVYVSCAQRQLGPPLGRALPSDSSDPEGSENSLAGLARFQARLGHEPA